MDKSSIEKICELQAEIDGYRRFVCDFFVSILKKEHRQFVVHDETKDASIIDGIWKEYDKIIDENEELARKLQSQKEKE